MKNKAIIWLRVSTKRQDLTKQREELTTFAKSEGYSEKDLIYIEGLGASAIKMDELYLDIITELEAKLDNEPVNKVYCWEISRIARDAEVWERLKKRLIRDKIQLTIFKPQTVNLLNGDGTYNLYTDLIMRFLMMMAESEMPLKQERFRKGRDKNRELGRWNGGANGALYGYLVDKSGFIRENTAESRRVKDIFDLYSTGKYSVRSLAVELKNRGWKLRGRDITDSNISNILSNPSYIGKNKAGIKYEAIITEELYNKVEAIRKGKDLGIRKSKESRYTHLAAKLLKCKDCGGNYTAMSGKYKCYKHSKPSRFLDNPCNNSLSISVEVMDNILWNVAREEEIAARMRYNTASIPELREQILLLTDKLEQIDVRVADIEDRKLRSTRSYNKGRISEEEEDRNQGELTLERFKVEAERERYLYEKQDIEDHIDDIISGKPVDTSDLDEYTLQQKKDLVQKHIKVATISKDYEAGKSFVLVEVVVMEGTVMKYKYYSKAKTGKKVIRTS